MSLTGKRFESTTISKEVDSGLRDPPQAIGVISLGRRRPGFDMEWGRQMENRARRRLQQTGFWVVEPPEKTIDDASLRQMARILHIRFIFQRHPRAQPSKTFSHGSGRGGTSVALVTARSKQGRHRPRCGTDKSASFASHTRQVMINPH